LRKSVLGIIAIVFVAAMMNPVHANGAFDQWGYNRTALVFKGWYVNAYAEKHGFATPYVGIKGDPCGNIDVYFSVTCDPTTGGSSNPDYPDYAYNVLLEINVNRAWDDAHRGATPWTPNAWLTNHQVGWYVGDDRKIHQWEWFLKIVWIGSGGRSSPYWRPGGYIGPDVVFYEKAEFELIQSVYNDPYGGSHGIETLATPPGLGWG
jgi:hypothetical protein